MSVCGLENYIVTTLDVERKANDYNPYFLASRIAGEPHAGEEISAPAAAQSVFIAS